MILGIDLIASDLASGTKSFNTNLLNQFLKNKSKEKIFIFITKNYFNNIEVKKIPKNIKLVIKPNFLNKYLFKIIWMQIILPFELKILGIKKIYSSMNYCPLICKIFNIQIILNVHSNLPWVYFDKMPGSILKNIFIKYFMFVSIKLSDKLVVNSYYAKKELIKKLKLKSKKIFVNYLGVEEINFKRKNKIEKIKFDFKNRYILSVASCVRYHNFINILDAFKNTNYKKKKIKLVLIMQILDKKYFEEIKNYVYKNFDNNEIFFFKNLNTNLLNKFYSKSFIYIFSSYCEVFGLTSLEAMKYKIPVLISNYSALPEVNGDAALYFNPNNPRDISIKINKLISSQRLRKSLIQKGKKQINKFKWINTYRNLMKIITKKI